MSTLGMAGAHRSMFEQTETGIVQYRWNGLWLPATRWGLRREAEKAKGSRGCGSVETRVTAGCGSCGETDPSHKNGRCGGAPGSAHAWIGNHSQPTT